MTRPPTTSTTMARAAIFSAARPTSPASLPAFAPPAPRSGGSRTRTNTANRSWTTSHPTAVWPSRVCSSWRSPSTRVSTTVLATDSDSPNTTAAGHPHPKAAATPVPSAAAARIWTSAPGTATRRTAIKSSRWKWSPTPNMSRITPTSANWPAISRLATNPGVFGPTTIPAKRYPTIGESPIRWVTYPRARAAASPPVSVRISSRLCMTHVRGVVRDDGYPVLLS